MAFIYFVRILDQQMIFSLHSINWLIFYNQDSVCLLHGMKWIFNSVNLGL
jgi:hypothetical protein